MRSATIRKDIGSFVLAAALVLLALPFALYALERGLTVTSAAEQATSRLFHEGAALSNAAIYGHMIAGALITVLAPLQLLTVVRRRWLVLHHLSGYIVTMAAGLTGIGGLVYILLEGTIGGPVMSLGFGIYGLLMLNATARTFILARRRDPLHRFWAEHLVILALASWLYRVHYGIWEIATGGAGSRPDFSGPFDIVQVFAFYAPYLLFHLWFWRWRSADVRGRLT